MRITERNTLIFVMRVGVVVYALFLIVAAIIWLTADKFDVFTGTLSGGGLSLINFYLLVWIGRKIFEDPKKLKTHYFILVWLKFFVLVALCFWIIIEQLVNIPSFFIGLSVIVIAIIVATAYSILQGFPDMIDEEWKKTEEKYIGWEDVDAPRKMGYKPKGKKSPFDEL